MNRACSVSWIREHECRLDFKLSLIREDFFKLRRMYSFWISDFSLSVNTSNSMGASLSHGCSRACTALSRLAGSTESRRLIKSLTSSDRIVVAALGLLSLLELALV